MISLNDKLIEEYQKPDCMDNEELKQKLSELHADCWGWALNCCFGNRHEAEDILQTAYLKILEGRAIYNQKSGFKTWVFAVIRNTAYSNFRIVNRSGLHVEIPKLFEKTAIEENHVDQTDETKWKLFFKHAFEKLSQRQKQIFHLVFYQDLSLAEAGEVLGLPVGTVRKYYDRGKKILKRCLDEEKMSNEI